jgi:gamma-glutamyltranspeptidase / glutathione hydrolase
MLRRKRYADLFEDIALNGPEVFYSGAIANATIRAVQQANGIMTVDNLKGYEVQVREPVQVCYRDFKMTSCGAPAGGSVVLNVMKTVEGYSDFGRDVSISTHRLEEAMRFGYELRKKLGDPTFADAGYHIPSIHA